MIWFCSCFPIHVLIGSTSNLLKLEDSGSILIGCPASLLTMSVLTSDLVSFITLIDSFFNFAEFSAETFGFLCRLLLKTLVVGCGVVSSNSSNWTSL